MPGLQGKTLAKATVGDLSLWRAAPQVNTTLLGWSVGDMDVPPWVHLETIIDTPKTPPKKHLSCNSDQSHLSCFNFVFFLNSFFAGQPLRGICRSCSTKNLDRWKDRSKRRSHFLSNVLIICSSTLNLRLRIYLYYLLYTPDNELNFKVQIDWASMSEAYSTK